MSVPIVSLTDIKTYLGKVGTDDDVLIASIASNATAKAEQDTGRVFSVTSNVTSVYSTDGQAMVSVRDLPRADSTRVVTLNGATMTENTNYWLLPDRRNPAVSTQLQVRPWDRSRPDWYKSDPFWFDKNLDRYPYGPGTPLDLSVTGTEGHPQVSGDVFAAIAELACWEYWRSKGGVSSYASSLSGTQVDLSVEPDLYTKMVEHWKVRTQVASV